MKQVQHFTKVFTFSIPVAILFALFLVSCATTPPQATFTKALPKEQHVSTNDTVVVKVEASQGVAIENQEKQRLSQQIKEKIDTQKMNNTESRDKHEYELDLLLTRYEKGNAFARFMLVGLGQIHVDAHVSLLALPERATVAEFDINKTFAWGGAYGAFTSIEDVEQGFAGGVAEAVTKAEQ